MTVRPTKPSLSMKTFKDSATTCLLLTIFRTITFLHPNASECFEYLCFLLQSVYPSAPSFINSEMLTTVDSREYSGVCFRKFRDLLFIFSPLQRTYVEYHSKSENSDSINWNRALYAVLQANVFSESSFVVLLSVSYVYTRNNLIFSAVRLSHDWTNCLLHYTINTCPHVQSLLTWYLQVPLVLYRTIAQSVVFHFGTYFFRTSTVLCVTRILTNRDRVSPDFLINLSRTPRSLVKRIFLPIVFFTR